MEAITCTHESHLITSGILGFICAAHTFQSNVRLGPRGGTDLERGYGDVRPWRPPFHASPAARKDPISSKRFSSQDPLLRKFGNFSLYSLNFHPNFSSQAPKFGNFQLTSSQIWKFSAHKPPFQRQMSGRKPHTSEILAAHPYLKKSWVPPPPDWGFQRHIQFEFPRLL